MSDIAKESQELLLLYRLQNEVATQSSKHSLYQDWDDVFAMLDELLRLVDPIDAEGGA